ncbi:potassium channel family protein [Streptomyces uncialis]|uniref:potassium channel family protein n=1 Tax=Streptomyces uncialis TaxID=1048205 RepID=UPI002E32934E|nr:potassium channel family protein [Streptomyces uncialis]
MDVPDAADDPGSGTAEPDGGSGRGPRHRRFRDPLQRWGAIAGTVTILVTLYFLLPNTAFGPDHPAVSWLAFIAALVLIATLLLRHIRDVLMEREGTHPAFAIVVLMCMTVLVFATAYLALARSPGEFEGGLYTRVDSLYFTVVTLATVGFGDITAHGQASRVVVIVQILYTFVFLTASATAVSTRLRSQLRNRSGANRAGRQER